MCVCVRVCVCQKEEVMQVAVEGIFLEKCPSHFSFQDQRTQIQTCAGTKTHRHAHAHTQWLHSEEQLVKVHTSLPQTPTQSGAQW